VLLMMDTKGVRNMYSILVVFNKHNTARVASCWFIICYIYVYIMRALQEVEAVATLIHVHMTLCPILTCDFSFGSLTLPALGIGYFVEEILLYTHHCIKGVPHHVH